MIRLAGEWRCPFQAESRIKGALGMDVCTPERAKGDAFSAG